jgi:hypothetical protein
MTVTVRAKLPKGDTNGLAHLEAALAADPDEVLVVVGLLRTDTIEARPHDDDDPRCVKTVLLHLEAVTDGDGAEVDRMLRKVYEQRTGKVELPFETDDD